MSEPTRKSTLYRLIEAGQLAHKALMVPLAEHGLEPGDDAVLFLVSDRKGATEDMLAAETGLGGEHLQQRLNRLIEHDLLVRQAVGPQLQPGVALTERGERMRAFLVENWKNLEEALFGELKKKKRKKLSELLDRISGLLQL